MVKLAGNETVGTFSPDQLYAGEADIVTTQGVVSSTNGALEEGHVVALVGGELVEWDSAGAGGAEIAYGVLPHAIPDSASDQDSPVFIGGVFNYDKLVTKNDNTYAELQAAFAGTNIVVQKLY